MLIGLHITLFIIIFPSLNQGNSAQNNVKQTTMTRFYQLWKRVPRERRKELAKFIHELKKLASRNNELIVVERLGKREKDYVYIDVSDIPIAKAISLLEPIRLLGDEFSIPRNNIRYGENEDCGFAIICDLYTDL